MSHINIATRLGGVGLAVLGVAMAVTNPNQAAYDRFASQTMTDYLAKEVCQSPEEVPEIFGNLLRQGCISLAKSSQPEIQQFISDNTQRQNLIFLSLYTTNLLAYRVKTIGIWRNFYIYDVTQISSSTTPCLKICQSFPVHFATVEGTPFEISSNFVESKLGKVQLEGSGVKTFGNWCSISSTDCRGSWPDRLTLVVARGPVC